VGEENRIYLVLDGRSKMHNANYKPESALQDDLLSFSQDSHKPADSPALVKTQSSEMLGTSVNKTKWMLVTAENPSLLPGLFHYIKYRYKYFQ
jgi:hypothetical protein